MRLCIVIAISNEGDLHYWNGTKWMDWDRNPTPSIPIWKDNQAQREAALAKRFLPRNISPENVIWPKVQRREITPD